MLERLEGGRGWFPPGLYKRLDTLVQTSLDWELSSQLWYLCTIEFHYIYDPKLAKPIAWILLGSRWDDTIARLG